MKSLDNRINSKLCLPFRPRGTLRVFDCKGKDICLRQWVSSSAVVIETVRNGSMEIGSVEVIKKKMPATQDVDTVHQIP